MNRAAAAGDYLSPGSSFTIVAKVPSRALSFIAGEYLAIDGRHFRLVVPYRADELCGRQDFPRLTGIRAGQSCARDLGTVLRRLAPIKHSTVAHDSDAAEPRILRQIDLTLSASVLALVRQDMRRMRSPGIKIASRPMRPTHLHRH
jgi:hypothetical protein